MNIPLALYAVSTPAGTSKSGHGISFNYNRAHVTKAERQARELRRLKRRQARGNWANESRGKAFEVKLDYGDN